MPLAVAVALFDDLNLQIEEVAQEEKQNLYNLLITHSPVCTNRRLLMIFFKDP